MSDLRESGKILSFPRKRESSGFAVNHLKTLDPRFRGDDERNNGELAENSVVMESLTTAAGGKRCHTSIGLFGLGGKATVKQSLTVRTWCISQATTEASSVVQPERTSHVRLS